jgi:hypothetical protein
MAKKAAPASPAIDPDKTYRVTLAKALQIGRRMVAGGNVRLRGDVLLETLAAAPDAVASYEEAAG